MLKIIMIAILLTTPVAADTIFNYHAAIKTRDGIGSAFELQPGLFVTNAHVVKNYRNVRIITSRHETRAAVLAVSPHMDLAILVAPE